MPEMPDLHSLKPVLVSTSKVGGVSSRAPERFLVSRHTVCQ